MHNILDKNNEVLFYVNQAQDTIMTSGGIFQMLNPFNQAEY